MSAQQTPVLEVERLCVEFVGHDGIVRPVEDVTFSIAAGEVLGVVGESGAGKTLTGAAVSGLIEPPGRIGAGSRIALAGQRIDDLPPAALRAIRGRRIGTIFQDPLTSLNPLFTIGDQIVETVRAHFPVTARAARERALALLHEVGIPAPEQRFGAYPHEFSGGMRQRVVIALALCADPDLVVADEPTTALDVSIQAQIIALLRRLAHDRGMAVMLITHDMGVIAQTASRVAVMYAGRIVETGTVAQVIEAPRHPYTRGLMASIPPIDRDRERLAQIEGAMPRPGLLPDGCAFHPRCPDVMAACRTGRPALLDSPAGGVACWLHAHAAGR